MRVVACITHVPVTVPYPPSVTTIHLGEAQAEGRLNLRDLASDWAPHHPLLGGNAGSFALKALLLRDHPGATSVGLCQYRKFVSRPRLSRSPAEGYKSMDVVQQASLTPERLAQAMDPGDAPFLICRPIRLRRAGLLDQYSRAHRTQDLLRFAAEAVAQGVLDNRDGARFMAEQVFIPGGIELGIFPADFWLKSIGAIEGVVRACIERYPVERDGYQVRAWAFCAERLGSFLLLKHFDAVGSTPLQRLAWALPSHWSNRYAGHLNLVTDPGEQRYTVGT